MRYLAARPAGFISSSLAIQGMARQAMAVPPPPVQLAEDRFLEVLQERRHVGLAHLGQAADDRLAGLQEHAQELRRHLVVVALVGGDVDDDVGQAADFEQARNVAGRGPGGHVGAVPDDEVLEQCRTVRVELDAADLVDVLVEVGRPGLL